MTWYTVCAFVLLKSSILALAVSRRLRRTKGKFDER